MTDGSRDRRTRREVFAGGVRWTAVALAGAFGGFVAAKKDDRPATAGCIGAGLCGRCGVFAECSLGPAQKAREDFARQSDG